MHYLNHLNRLLSLKFFVKIFFISILTNNNVNCNTKPTNFDSLKSLEIEIKPDFCTEGVSPIEFGIVGTEQLDESALRSCGSLDNHFVECRPVTETKILNNTQVHICQYFGTSKGPLLYANVSCHVLQCIECYGPRLFTRSMPCKKYTGHYFLTAWLYSVFLGILAVDRFYLGYSAIAVGKLMTLGGLGVWWIVDIVLLINGNLMPADESEWNEWR